MVNWEKLLRIKSTRDVVEVESPPRKSLNRIVIVLIAGNIFCGVANIHSWPFSAYPAFSPLTPDNTEILEFTQHNSEGLEVIIPRNEFHRFFQSERFRNLELRAIDFYRNNQVEEFKTSVHNLTGKITPVKIGVKLVTVAWKDTTIRREEKFLMVVE